VATACRVAIVAGPAAARVDLPDRPVPASSLRSYRRRTRLASANQSRMTAKYSSSAAIAITYSHVVLLALARQVEHVAQVPYRSRPDRTPIRVSRSVGHRTACIGWALVTDRLRLSQELIESCDAPGFRARRLWKQSPPGAIVEGPGVMVVSCCRSRGFHFWVAVVPLSQWISSCRSS
jgi:hypothetical protein